MSRTIKFLITVMIISTCFGNVVFSHGAKLEYKSNVTYEIKGSYDTGEPLSNAQVIVYAPSNPKIPFKKGFADGEGKYLLEFNPKDKGDYLVQFRKGGHGASITINNSDNVQRIKGDTGINFSQRIIMIACVLWGFVGTTLFFIARRK